MTCIIVKLTSAELTAKGNRRQRSFAAEQFYPILTGNDYGMAWSVLYLTTLFQ
jgi:hypothetical protein